VKVISAVNKIRSRFGSRTAVAIAGSVGFALGAGGWVAASHGGDDPSPATTSSTGVESTIVPTSGPSTSGVETTVVTTIDPIVTSTVVASTVVASTVVPTSVDVSVSTSVVDASTTIPNTTIDDDDDDDDADADADDDDVSTTSSSPANTAASSSTSVPAPAPFTKTYQSAGGSITVTWNGVALSLDAVSPSAGFEAEIDDQASDRVRVEFDNGDADWRIEVRFNDGAIRERITN
jgi:hypothetical protein